MTGLTQSELRRGVRLSEAVAQFRKWCGEKYLLFTWGPNDIPMLKDNLRFFGMSTSWIPNWYNAQCFFNQQTENKGRQYSIDFALNFFSIEADSERHDALNDAYYTGKILEKLDIGQGISRYDDQPLYMDNIVIEETRNGDRMRFNGYETKNDALSDKRVIRSRCTECRKHLAMTKPATYGSSKMVSMGKCQMHGDFFVEFKIKPSHDKKYCIIKTVKKINPREKNDILTRINRWNKAKLLLGKRIKKDNPNTTDAQSKI